ncbi:MAG: glycosyltransferase, partial [Gemmatimonadaceae bacterium]
MQYGCRLGWRIDAFCSEAPRTLREHGEELLARVPREATLHVVPPSSREPSYRFFPRVDGGFANALGYARHAIGTMAQDPPDVVLASGPPFFTFVAARLVARHFGVPLVLDYRDEWTECPFDFVDKGPHDRALESRCLRSADAVFFTTESHRRNQLAAFPELDARKTHVVPNGWEPSDFVEPDREPRAPALADVRT